MNRRFSWTSITLILLASILTSCGGGGEAPCASNVSGTVPVGIYFQGLDVNHTSVTFKVNEPAALNTRVGPSECRASMTFAVKSGSIPPGMQLDDGNVIGTPTVIGEYKLQLMITEIKGYSMTADNNPSTMVATIKVRKN